ncbi:hypothetical protein IVB12_15965 [Bradyrhizobium sp. 179]|uniref:hypothetical protein n=1 Tax=Bradyrhizobium sp. 179 TaxID=2782648 RepID=UPI001FF88FE0|nr:hypothetical protein [Bradyrhizobium sp. 179]MCK1543413.1 hypothetical protein [Bradyrhizobium sp. 179]
MRKNTTIAPAMQMQRSNHLQMFAVESMRLLDGETAEAKAAREAAEAEAARVAAEKAEADRIAAEKAEADRIAAEKAADEAERKRLDDEKAAKKLTDKEYEFLTDALKHKQAARDAKAALDAANAKLKDFEGLDAAAIKKLVADQKKAADDAKAAELKAAEAAGNVERIKQMMGEEHQKVVSELETKLAEKDNAINAAQKTIEDLTVGSAFSQSAYIRDELVLTPAIARQVYAPHFDVVNGKPVPFDKPRGEPGRTQLVDASGNALSVDAALKKIIEASPDRDRLVRSKIGTGASSKTEKTTGSNGGEDNGLRGAARIAAALEAGALKKAPAK